MRTQGEKQGLCWSLLFLGVLRYGRNPRRCMRAEDKTTGYGRSLEGKKGDSGKQERRK